MLQVRNARVRLDDVQALDGVDFDVAEGTIAGVLGASGSGKSTLLRLIAGLESGGSVTWRGTSYESVPVHQRPFGLMFQDHALFPHLNVAANVAFGLEMHHHHDVAGRVAEALEMVGLAGYERRNIATLSGGEAQRVALARAIAPEPELLMLDEPLGSLDRVLRDRLLDELRDLLGTLDMTAIYVTHDHDEARTLATEVTILDQGRVLQAGPVAEVWDQPKTVGVARFLGYTAIGHVEVRGAEWTTPWGVISGHGLPDGRHLAVALPQAVRFVADGALSGRVTGTRFVGGRAELQVAAGGAPLTGSFDDSPVPPRGALVRFDLDHQWIRSLAG